MNAPAAPLVEVAGLAKHYPMRAGLFGQKRLVRAVAGVDLAIARSEVLGLVGESGSGKTTVGRCVLRLVEPTAGSLRFDGHDLLAADPAAMRRLRRRMQIVFQDPFGSLDPRRRVLDLVAEGLDIHGLADAAGRAGRVAALLALVGLDPAHAGRLPHEFSGGQRQRIGIARALALEPDFIVADEPVSALDVSVQAQIVALLADLRARLGLSMLFISHDLAVVRHLSDRVAVMYLGRIVETAPTEALFDAPRHPYTRALLEAAPEPDPARRGRARTKLAGDPPSPADPPSGCAFRTRCVHALARCAEAVPALREVAPGHAKACIRDDI
ncbi:MAG: ABC transporter ATP-binding protein [Acetobacteraceae bacterium]|nr:ABC transporter ATP-binding protein [Acetobacteraceae bacterium]